MRNYTRGYRQTAGGLAGLSARLREQAERGENMIRSFPRSRKVPVE